MYNIKYFSAYTMEIQYAFKSRCINTSTKIHCTFGYQKLHNLYTVGHVVTNFRSIQKPHLDGILKLFSNYIYSLCKDPLYSHVYTVKAISIFKIIILHFLFFEGTQQLLSFTELLSCSFHSPLLFPYHFFCDCERCCKRLVNATQGCRVFAQCVQGCMLLANHLVGRIKQRVPQRVQQTLLVTPWKQILHHAFYS